MYCSSWGRIELDRAIERASPERPRQQAVDIRRGLPNAPIGRDLSGVDLPREQILAERDVDRRQHHVGLSELLDAGAPVLVDRRQCGAELLERVPVADQPVLVHGGQRADQLVSALAVGVFLEPEGDVLVVPVKLHEPSPVAFVEPLGSLPGRDAGLNGLLKRGHRDVTDPGQAPRAPRSRDLAQVALRGGGIVVPTTRGQSRREKNKDEQPRASARQGPVQRILHVN